MSSTSAQTWYSLHITVLPKAAEAIEFALNELDSLGTEIDHLRKTDEDTVRVSGYFSEPLSEDAVNNALLYSLEVYGHDDNSVIAKEWETVGQTDWLAEWKKHWKPTTVGRFVVSPPWEDPAGEFVIKIEPNMAFGTGTHDTTRLCLDAIDRLYQPNESFLDVGTGTGILSIAAAMLVKANDPESAPKITACDNDTDSVTIARENLALNSVASYIDLYEGTLNPSTPSADFVCANLTLDVIEPILPMLLERSRRLLLLSGILAEQEPQIRRALEKEGINDIDVAYSGEWISVVVGR
ncbi:MAG: 50S ribosomal protein L11 methyltransferase [Acidobacteria bacterium]|nr:50S ribosomal protein L11 methyltransferase [Acidobacteriota bacterium]